MRFFHLSDLHIGLKLMNRDLGEDQAYILHQIVTYAAQEQPDAIVIAGDIYDKAVPSAEAVEIFDRFLSELVAAVPRATIMMISGNHDSAPRVDCYRHILAGQRVYMIGQPPRKPQERIQKVILEDAYGPVNFYLLPFVKPSMVREIMRENASEAAEETTGENANEAVGESVEKIRENAAEETTAEIPEMEKSGSHVSYEEAVKRLLERERIDQGQRNVLVSHQFYLPAGSKAEEVERMDSEVRTLGNIDEISAELLKPFDYAALGHIHKPMKVGNEIYRYCGTPLACSVSEAGQEKGIILVELGEKSQVRKEMKAEAKTEVETEMRTEVKIKVRPLHPLRQVKLIRGKLEEVLPQACRDYVTVVLTDQEDLNILDMQDRLRNAFPNLLEIRRDNLPRVDYSRKVTQGRLLDPFALCCAFLQETGEEEKALLQDVIHSVEGVK